MTTLAGRLELLRARHKCRRATSWLRRLGERPGPLVAGPWTGGRDLELLYWVPLLRWLSESAGVDPARVVAISSGGVDDWYRDVAGTYIDLFDHYPPAEVRRWTHGRLDAAAEASLIQLAVSATRVSAADRLLPSTLDGLLAPRSAAAVRAHTVHRLVPDDGLPPYAATPYVVVHVAFNDWFRDTVQNRSFVDTLLDHLGAQSRLVLLGSSGGVPVVRVVADARIESTERLDPRHALGVQTRIIHHAEAMFATHGGLSFVGPYVATPTVAFYAAAGFDVAHLDELERAAHLLTGRRSLYRARHTGHFTLTERL